MNREVTTCIRCGQTGGMFRYTTHGYVHHNCGKLGAQTMNFAKNNFRFDSMHISDNPNMGPVEVNSLHHLRQLEREHGVISVLANYDRQDEPLPGGKPNQFQDRR